jgi:hypothetical protein
MPTSIALCSPVLLVFQHKADPGPTLADRFCTWAARQQSFAVNTPPFSAAQ